MKSAGVTGERMPAHAADIGVLDAGLELPAGALGAGESGFDGFSGGRLARDRRLVRGGASGGDPAEDEGGGEGSDQGGVFHGSRERRWHWFTGTEPHGRERAGRTAVPARIPCELNRDCGKESASPWGLHVAWTGRGDVLNLPSMLALSHSGWRLSIRRWVHFQPKLAGARPELLTDVRKAAAPDLIR